MSLVLRSEQPGDEDAIDLVNFLAFEEWNRREDGLSGHQESDLVRYLRAYCPRFDRRYSIVAWDGERAVGHALFIPAEIRLLGATVSALAVGPVAVIPEYQRRGIGGELLAFGHDLGRRDSFRVAFLMGRPSYYPRHGYVPCHGFAKVTFDLEKLPGPTREFVRRPVCSADIPWLRERAAAEWADVDFGWLWGEGLMEWYAPGMTALMWWTDDGRRAAYTLANPRREWQVILAEDPNLAREVIATLRPASLPQHPSGWLAREVLDPVWASVEVNPHDAAMACELQPGALGPLREALEFGTRPLGFCNWPIPYLLIV